MVEDRLHGAQDHRLAHMKEERRLRALRMAMSREDCDAEVDHHRARARPASPPSSL